MLLWANKNEVDIETIKPIGEMYSKEDGEEYLRNSLKGWELSVILRQIREHFGKRKDISILDFGAGGSPFGAFLNRIGYQDITCLDKPDAWHPEINQETYNKKYGTCIKYIKTDITRGYNEEHDVIFSASVLEHIKGKGRHRIMQALSDCLKPGGLFIHAVDYGRGINFKKLINSCDLSISYVPKETPGCEEYEAPPKFAWMEWVEKRKKWKSCIAFFNERGCEYT